MGALDQRGEPVTTAASRVIYANAEEHGLWMPTGGSAARAYGSPFARCALPGTGTLAVMTDFVFPQGLVYPLLLHFPEAFPADEATAWSRAFAMLDANMLAPRQVIGPVDTPLSHIMPARPAPSAPDMPIDAPVTVTAQEQIDLVQDAISLGISHIAEILGVGRDTVHRWSRGDTLLPRDPAVVRRLRDLVNVAESWNRRCVHGLGTLVTAPLGDSRPSLYDLLREPVWERGRIDDALDALAARVAARHEGAPQAGTSSSSPVSVQRQQLRQTVQRGRFHRR